MNLKLPDIIQIYKFDSNASNYYLQHLNNFNEFLKITKEFELLVLKMVENKKPC